MPRRALPTCAWVLVLTLTVATAGPATAQPISDVDANESGNDGNATDGGGLEDPEEAMGPWWNSLTGLLVIIVLSVVVMGLIVALAIRR